jgi:hypothetical protein
MRSALSAPLRESIARSACNASTESQSFRAIHRLFGKKKGGTVPRPPIAAMLLAFALAACGSEAPVPDAPDTLPPLDPALAAALAEPLMVDPDLGSQANDDALRPPPRPLSGAVPPIDIAPIALPELKLSKVPPPEKTCPVCTAAEQALTLGALAAAQSDEATRTCAAEIGYSARWAARLPKGAPLFPDARVREAAGSDAGTCALRAVRYMTAAPVDRVIDFYFTRTRKAGYSADHQAHGERHALTGARDGAANTVIARPRADGGSEVSLVVNTRD